MSRNPSARGLASRDLALAAMMGAIGSSDFGGEYDERHFGGDFGFEFGDDYGYEFGDEPGAAPARPTQQAAAAAWNAQQQRATHTKRRTMLLEPNAGSAVKVERYAFSVNSALVLGTPSLIAATNSPDTNIRPQRVTMNAPSPGFALITDIKVANVSVTVGGIEDAFDYNALGVGQSLDMPTLSPSNKASVAGNYTGFVPPGFVGGADYTFCASFKGPASIVA